MYSGTKIESVLDGFNNLVALEEITNFENVIKSTRFGIDFTTPVGNKVPTFYESELITTTSGTGSALASKASDCFVVTTRSRRTLVVGADSRLLVSDAVSGGLVAVSPSNALGELVPVWLGNTMPAHHFSFDLGWWYAVLVADGWIGRNVVGYSKNDRAKRERFVEIARSQFTLDFSLKEHCDAGDSEAKYAASTKVYLNGSELPELIEQIHHDDFALNEDGKRGALFKMLPRNLLLNSSNECLWGILSGLLDGDSSLGWNYCKETRRFYCKLNTSSPYLKDDIVFLLRKLGIRCSVTDVPAKGNSHASYVICISIVSLRSAVQHIRCVGDEENRRLSEFSEEYTRRAVHDQIDLIPFPGSIAQEIRTAVGTANANLYSTVAKAADLKRITREAVIARIPVEILRRTASTRSLYQLASNPKLLWDEVVSVTPAPQQVLYNVEVDNGLPLVLWDGWIVPSYLPEVDIPAQLN